MNASRTTTTIALALLACACDGNGVLPPDRDPYEGEEPAMLDCIPNLDGQIDADEIPLVLDTEVAYLVSPPQTTRSVDTIGTGDGEMRQWDWSVDLADDQLARLAARSIEGKWYEREFPPDAFVAPFDDGGAIDTVSRQDERGLYLLGVASSKESPSSGQTLLIYDEPIELIRFPIEAGTSYQQVGTIENAVFNGIPYAAVDTYDVEVVSAGELLLPSFTFTQAQQIRIALTVEPALGEPTSVRQVSFFFECFGEIARATSQLNETDPAFSEAAEVRRLGY